MHVIINVAGGPYEQPITNSAMDMVRPGDWDTAESRRAKALAAALISACENIRDQNSAAGRVASLAITAAEEAAMWAAKAATTPKAGR